MYLSREEYARVLVHLLYLGPSRGGGACFLNLHMFRVLIVLISDKRGVSASFWPIQSVPLTWPTDTRQRL